MAGKHNRRYFLAQAGLGVAGLALGGYQATARGYAANEAIQVGCIGTGGRCLQLMHWLQQLPGVKIVAVCDVWDTRLAQARDLAGPDAWATKDYTEILADDNIDAVIIGTPDHLHTPMTIAACEAGKDVYVEKPLTHHREEGQAVIDAQNTYQRIVQVGMQQRSMPHLIEAKAILDSGELGPIRKVHMTWNRNQERAEGSENIDPATVDWARFLGHAPEQPFDPYRFRNWRWFWDFGGGIFTDLMVHQIDIAQWFLDQEHPAHAASIGSFFTNEGVWETPDTVQSLLHYKEPETQFYFQGTFYNARYRAMMEYMGSEGTLYCDRGRYEVYPEPGSTLERSEMILGSGPRGLDFYDQPEAERLHLSNWLECIRSREKPNAPAEAGVQASDAAHLANKALRENIVAHW